MKSKIALLSLLVFSLIPAPAVQAQELPDFVVKAVAQVSTYSQPPFEPENVLKQGSGVFIDHGGCLYTNSHVVLNLDTDEVLPHIVVNVSVDRAKPPEKLFEGELIYVDQALDLALVCPQEELNLFTHFFDRKDVSEFETRPFGTDIWVMGYPEAGIETITISPGHIVGFIDAPDTTSWVGVPDLDESYLKLYKSDALAGPGISGGLLVDKDLELIGVPFAGSFVPGAFVFSLSEEVYLEFDNRVRVFKHAEGLVPTDCVYDTTTHYWRSAGQIYYDEQCTLAFDDFMEHEVKQTWRAFCGDEISQRRLVAAIRRSKELGSLGPWSDNMLLICPQDSAAEEPVAIEGEEVVEVELSAGEFAYGKARLNSLEQEQALAVSLKSQIDASFPQLQIHSDDWSTVVNSYIYGGYSVSDINKAIELGGVTVHPTIPFEAWSTSVDYLSAS